MLFRHNGTQRWNSGTCDISWLWVKPWNFTKAAAQLRVAQPALSRQVQDLEDEIGVDLMKRSPRGVTLTAEGKFFLDEVR